MYLLEKMIFLVNLTFAVYISNSGCTMTFGANSEGSMMCFLFARCRRRQSLKSQHGLYTRFEPRAPGVRSPVDSL